MPARSRRKGVRFSVTCGGWCCCCCCCCRWLLSAIFCCTTPVVWLEALERSLSVLRHMLRMLMLSLTLGLMAVVDVDLWNNSLYARSFCGSVRCVPFFVESQCVNDRETKRETERERRIRTDGSSQSINLLLFVCCCCSSFVVVVALRLLSICDTLSLCGYLLIVACFVHESRWLLTLRCLFLFFSRFFWSWSL